MSFKQNVKYMMKYYFFIFETCDVVEIEIKIEYKNVWGGGDLCLGVYNM